MRSQREIAIPLAERPTWGDLISEICHWSDGYHLNVRLYKKLLLSVFDILDEGKWTKEVWDVVEFEVHMGVGFPVFNLEDKVVPGEGSIVRHIGNEKR